MVKTYEDGLKDAMEAIDNLRIIEAGDFKSPRCQGQRGQDRSDALYDAYKVVQSLNKV